MIKRIIVILLMLIMLDQSIDFDYLTFDTKIAHSVGYDDIDSISEFIIESVTGDSHTIVENESEDTSAPTTKSKKAHIAIVWYHETQKPIELPQAPIRFYNTTKKISSEDQDQTTCNGYYNIISPPPDVYNDKA